MKLYVMNTNNYLKNQIYFEKIHFFLKSNIIHEIYIYNYYIGSVNIRFRYVIANY